MGLDGRKGMKYAVSAQWPVLFSGMPHADRGTCCMDGCPGGQDMVRWACIETWIKTWTLEQSAKEIWMANAACCAAGVYEAQEEVYHFYQVVASTA